MAPMDHRLMDAMTVQTAIALERIALQADLEQALVVSKVERLRAVLGQSRSVHSGDIDHRRGIVAGRPRAEPGGPRPRRPSATRASG